VHEEAFKKICDFVSGARDNMRIENEKCDPKAFKKFLESRYDKRIAQKIHVLFDWSGNSINYASFMQTIKQVFLRPAED
jgi:hypothetical protein